MREKKDSEVQLKIQSLSKPICAQQLCSIIHVHITYYLHWITSGPAACRCSGHFALGSRKRHEISAEAQRKKGTHESQKSAQQQSLQECAAEQTKWNRKPKTILSGMAKYFQFRRKYFSVQVHMRNTCDLAVLCHSRLV